MVVACTLNIDLEFKFPKRPLNPVFYTQTLINTKEILNSGFKVYNNTLTYSIH